MEVMFQLVIDENVQYFEIKFFVYNKIYLLDFDFRFVNKYGKYYVDNDLGEEEFYMVEDVLN